VTRFVACLLFLAAWLPPIEAPPRIVIVMSADAPPYQQALSGLRRDLLSTVPNATLDVIPLRGDTARVAEALQTIRGNGTPATLIVTLGALATRTLLGRVNGVPIVAGMILNAGELRGTANATGVYLEFPVDVELDWLRRLLPGSRHVGVLYHGDESGRRVAEARRIAAASGGHFTVEAIRVEDPSELPDALSQLTNRADVLWSLNDPIVYNPETARSLLVFSLRNRIPFIGQSSAWVRAGALYALERDYDDVGAQCAQLAVRILRGEDAGSLAPASPRKVRYSLNRHTAVEMRFALTDAVVRGAVEVVN
jgi:putative tryptophan/tyrosine transport system substrate-binding protein